MTFPYSKFLSALARLANVLMDYMDDRKWRDKQARRKNEKERIDDWVEKRLANNPGGRRTSDRVRTIPAKIKAESSE